MADQSQVGLCQFKLDYYYIGYTIQTTITLKCVTRLTQGQNKIVSPMKKNVTGCAEDFKNKHLPTFLSGLVEGMQKRYLTTMIKTPNL